MKGRLKRLHRFLVPVQSPAFASDTARGYLAVPMTVEQENYLWQDSQRLSAETRRRVRVVYGLGLGCGLTAKEIASIKGDAVRIADHGVEVAVERHGEVTWIPCRRVWESRLWQEIRDLDTSVYLYSGTATSLDSRGISALLARAQREGQWACNTHEMRNTWLVRLLDAELPLFTILELAGMRNPHHLYRLRDHVAAVPLSRYDERVREA